MKRVCVLACSALLLVLWVLPARAIRNGDPEDRLQYNGVGTILPTSGHTRCTGTMVSPFVVLTAGQCMRDSASNPVFDFSLSPTRTARVKAFVVHPEFATQDGLNVAFDVALLRLDRAVARTWKGISLSAVRDSPMSTGVLATAIGFGETRTGQGGGSRTSGGLSFTQYIGGADSIGDPISNAVLEAVPGTARNAMICAGDTGGPLFFEGWIAGVASFRYVATCDEDGPGYYVAVEHVADWIRDTLNDLDPPGACRANDGAVFATREGGCKDLATSKIWSDVGPTKLTQPNAITYCYRLQEAGRSDWRLPTDQELHDLDMHGATTQLDLAGSAWSATDASDDPDHALLFHFGGHKSVETQKSSAGNVMCVRGA